jgi:hypothetical protein
MFLLEEAQLGHRGLMWGLRWLPHSSGELETWLLFNRQDLGLLQELWVSVKLNYLTKQLGATSRILWLRSSCVVTKVVIHSSEIVNSK